MSMNARTSSGSGVRVHPEAHAREAEAEEERPAAREARHAVDVHRLAAVAVELDPDRPRLSPREDHLHGRREARHVREHGDERARRIALDPDLLEPAAELDRRAARLGEDERGEQGEGRGAPVHDPVPGSALQRSSRARAS
jgi:hypothetical protein